MAVSKCFNFSASDYLQGAPLVVCTTTILPFVDCKNPKAPAGFDLEVFRQTASLSGLIEGVEYSFKCMDTFSGMLDAVSTCECDAAIGSITPTIARTCVQNITFSSPYFPTSLGVLTKVSEDKSMFTFFRPFDLDLWLLIVFTTALIIPLLTLILRRLELRRPSYPVVRRFPYVAIDSIQAVLGNADTGTQELQEDTDIEEGGRLIPFSVQVFFMCYAFFCLVITSLFTANLAAFATLNILRPSITSIDQLSFMPDLKVMTNNIYAGALEGRYGIRATPWDDFQGSETVVEAANMVANGTLDAVVTDRGLLAYALKTSENKCSLAMVADADLSFFGLSVAWSDCISSKAIELWNVKILQVAEGGELERLARGSLNDLFSMTIAGGGGAGESTFCAAHARDSVQLQNVAGLWIILAAGFVVSFLIAASPRLSRLQVRGWSGGV